MNFKGKKIAVLGKGVEGQSSFEFLQKQGADVEVFDKNDSWDNLSNFDLIVRSPGIKLDDLEKYKEKLTSQTKLFFDLCPCSIIGITGTKGKGTTSALIYEMLKEDEKDAYLGGNIGRPPFEFLHKLNPQSVVVLELSSFQLQDLEKSPHIAVVLMLTQDHIDYHGSIENYVGAKRNILRFQDSEDFAVINKDYPASRESDIHTKAKVFYVSREGEPEEGCFVKEGKVVIKKGNLEKEIVPVSDILLPGAHNWENVCAASMAASLAGVSDKTIRKVLKTFKGLEHRLELVAEIKGVRYYDDSFATTPYSTIAAIEAFEEPEILILGGSSKGADFSELGEVINNSRNIKTIIGIGQEWGRIKEVIKNSSIKIVEGCQNMEEIVKKASGLAEDGDVVLLSPACASFGMFKDYKDRGNQFKSQVNNLLK